jgi:2-deoxy-D-gluconate 3-dehydrogenase
MKLFDLSGRVAVITGGNGGIGLAIAQGFAEAGGHIALIGRNESKGAEALASLATPEKLFLSADLSHADACRRMVSAVLKRFGRIDILVNNAGIAIRKAPQDYSEQEWHDVIETNLSSAFFCSQAAYPAMKQQGGGKIINIGSMMSLFGAPFAVAYAASKGGMVQLTKALATAWAVDNIQVNAILPGWIDTDLTARARAEVPGLNEQVLARTPAGRWGKPRDLAGAAIFLASAASDFVTGAAFPVDGGYSARA